MQAVPDDATYDELCVKVKKHLRYEGGGVPLTFFLIILMPILVLWALAIFFNLHLDSNWIGLTAVGSVLLGFGYLAQTRRKLWQYPVDDSEWAIYYARPVYVNVVKSRSKTNSEGMRRDYRKKALQCARDLLLCMEQRWTVGEFKPIKEYEKGSVSELEENFRYRIIPAIKNGDNAVLEKVETIMFNFLHRAKTLHIEDIMWLNQRIADPNAGLPDKKPSKTGYITRFLGFLRPRKQDVVALGFIGVVSVAALIGFLVWGLSKESAITDTLILFGILMGAYVSIRLSKNR